MWPATAGSPARTRKARTPNCRIICVLSSIRRSPNTVAGSSRTLGMGCWPSSAASSVRCAVDIQRGMAERNADVPGEKRIELRIGINVGDIIMDRGDIFGDGVNVAARLEAVAEPSGICVSGRALEDIEGKLDIGFE